MKKIKLKALVKPQEYSSQAMNEALVVPFCSQTYTHSPQTTVCSGTYSSNLWCVTKPADEDEVLL